MTQFNDPIRVPKSSGKSDIEAESSIGRKEKPNRRPDSKKDFKEVYEKDKKEGEVSKGKTKEAPGKQASGSIFDLSAQKGPAPMASAMGKKMGKKVDEELSEAVAGMQPREGLAPERQDLVTTRTEPTIEMTPARTQEMKDLVEQVAKTLTIVKAKGQTETIMTLKHPPLFEGAQLKMTAYESAKGEFNLTFTNLTQEAKNLLDAHQNGLHQTLDSRGFIVHIVVTSTVDEGPATFEGEPTAKQEKEDQGQGEQQSRGQEQSTS